MPEGEVRVISGSSGSADGFRVARPRSPGVLDPFADAKPRLSKRGREARLRVNPEQAPAFMPGSRGVDMFPALIYASVRWRDGIIDAKTRLQPAQQKTKYLWRV